MKEQNIIRNALRVAIIGITMQVNCSMGGVITPSGVSSTTSGETVDISTVYPDGVISTSKENALQTGIGASSGGQVVWSGNDLIVSADRYGLYSENENSLSIFL